jgi:hypothetical protein
MNSTTIIQRKEKELAAAQKNLPALLHVRRLHVFPLRWIKKNLEKAEVNPGA